MLALPINIMIPINFITVFSICTLGFPALFSFIIIYGKKLVNSPIKKRLGFTPSRFCYLEISF